VNVEKHRREITVNIIMEKIPETLDRIRRIERTLPSRQQSVRSSKSVEDEHGKVRSGSVSNASSIRRVELSYPRVESIIEGESAL